MGPRGGKGYRAAFYNITVILLHWWQSQTAVDERSKEGNFDTPCSLQRKASLIKKKPVRKDFTEL